MGSTLLSLRHGMEVRRISTGCGPTAEERRCAWPKARSRSFLHSHLDAMVASFHPGGAGHRLRYLTLPFQDSSLDRPSVGPAQVFLKNTVSGGRVAVFS